VEVVEESARSLVLRVSAIPPLRHAIAVPQYGLSIGEASLNFRHDASVLEISVSSPPGDQLELELDA
jgi:hypothetical protein